MKAILRLKNWQMGILVAGPVVLAYGLYMYTYLNSVFFNAFQFQQDPSEILAQYSNFLTIIPTVMLLTVLGSIFSYLWLFAIGNALTEKLPEGTSMNKVPFNISIGLILVITCLIQFYIVSFLSTMGQFFTNPELAADFFENNMPKLFTGIALIALGSLLVMVTGFYCIYFVAKLIKTVELQKEVSFSDYVAEFFLVWFSYVGVWVLQGRLNKFVDRSPEEIKLLLEEDDKYAG